MKKFEIIYKSSNNCIVTYKGFIGNLENVDEAKSLWLSSMYGNGYKGSIEIISINEKEMNK